MASSRGSLGDRKGGRRTPFGRQSHLDRLFPSTNSSHQQWASLLNSRVSSRHKGTSTRQCLWTNICSMPMSTYKGPSPVPRQSKPSTALSAWPRTWASAFITIMLTMVDSRIMASSKIVKSNVEDSPIAESMHTSKMALQRRRSTTFSNRHG